MDAYTNPFNGMSDEAIYEGLKTGRFGPHWPDDEAQRKFTGTFGPALVTRGLSFIRFLDDAGVFTDNWRGLDHGCGWGRFPSLMLSRGAAAQYDVCDAWPASLDLFRKSELRNKSFLISEMIESDELPPNDYDFITSFSVFTHLSQDAFDHNIKALMRSLKLGGKLFLTVRHDDFIRHNRPHLLGDLERDGFVFCDPQGRGIFGNSAIARGYLNKFGVVTYIDKIEMQHVYSLSA